MSASNTLEPTSSPLVEVGFKIYSDSLGFTFQLNKAVTHGLRREFQPPTDKAFEPCNDIDPAARELIAGLLNTPGVTKVQFFSRLSFTVFTGKLIEPSISFPSFVAAIRQFYQSESVTFILTTGSANPMDIKVTDLILINDPLLDIFRMELSETELEPKIVEILAVRLASLARINKRAP